MITKATDHAARQTAAASEERTVQTKQLHQSVSALRSLLRSDPADRADLHSPTLATPAEVHD